MEQSELVPPDPEGREEEPAPEQGRGDHATEARAHAVLPLAAHAGGEAEKDVGEGEDEAHRAQLPVLGQGLADPEHARQGQVEDAEGVGLPDAQVDGEGRGHVPPAVEAGTRDDAFLREEAGHYRKVLADSTATPPGP